MTRAFRKMHGLGNDFVVIDCREEPLALSPAGAAALADRRYGIGCDTVVLIEPGDGGADAGLRFINADGGAAGACGNATRCVAQLLFNETGAREATLQTEGGLLHALAAPDGLVTVDMGPPKFDWQDIPLAEPMDTVRLEVQVGPIDTPILKQPSAANMGNPHCIFFVEDAGAYDLSRIGPLVEHHPLFPQGVNMSLAEVRGPNDIRLRVWERGAGQTLACGTAACATVAAGARRGLCDRKADIELDGGVLTIDWRAADGHIHMTGPTAESFVGHVDIEALEARAGQRRRRPQ